MSLRKIAKKLPQPVQALIKRAYSLVPAKLRYGKVFWQTYDFLNKSQFWSKNELQNYQIVQLNKLLNHAYKNVPYYNNLFNTIGLKPDDIQNLEDFKKFPLLTKEIVRENINELLSGNHNIKNLYTAHTSGTTGKPLKWYISLEEEQAEYAFICHQWSRVGFNPGDKVIQLRGKIIKENKKNEYDPVFRILRLSPEIDSLDLVRDYLKLMEDFGAKFIHGYPSVIALFAHWIKQNKLKVNFKIKAAMFASEQVFDWQRNLVGEVFNCRAYSHYGNAEKVTLAGECEKSYKYHSIPQYGITEIINNEIVGTSLINYVTPFIRYKTTDIIHNLENEKTCGCGRNYYPVFDFVEGRLEDFLIGSSGSYISPAVITHAFKDFKQIENSQIYQGKNGDIQLKIAPLKGFNSSELEIEVKELVENIIKIIGEGTKVEPFIVDKIAKTQSGKFRWIISELSGQSFEKGFIDSK